MLAKKLSFDTELFYRLCEKYGVELSDKYDNPMIKEKDGTIRPLSDDDVLNFLPKEEENV